MTAITIGQLAKSEDRFCPFAAVTKWPYRHLHGNNSEIISAEYFANGKFRSRGWTIYCIQTLPDDTEAKTLFLIPQEEVELLFKEIYTNFGIFCSFPDATRHPGFLIDFEEGPKPRYLGRLTDDTSLLDLDSMVPDALGKEPLMVEDRSLPAFRRKMEAAIQAGKQNKKNVRDRKRRDRVTTKQGWCAQLKRAQCYLGIKPRGTVSKNDYHSDPNQTYEETQAAQEAYERAAGIKLPRLVPTEDAPYPFHLDVVFVCVDVEAYEKDQKKVTEIGISTLDTRDLQFFPPGEGGTEWMKKIRARHFRIAEYGHLNNTEFLAGCADKFEEKFGASEWISKQEAPQVIASCFRYPFSRPGEYLPYPSTVNQVGRHGSGSRYLPPINDAIPKRNIVLVGHDIKADIEFLRTIGYDVTNLSNLLEAIDTADLFKAMKHEQQSRRLGAVLLELDLIGWNLHNAGNDAGYTMEALIGISFAALKMVHEITPSLDHLDAAAAEAMARLTEEVEEWEIADEEGGDGGEAIKLPSYEDMKAKQEFDQGLRRAKRVEDQKNIKLAKDRVSGGGKGRGHSLTHEKENSPSLHPGEIKFHAANEQNMREMSNQAPQHSNDLTEANLKKRRVGGGRGKGNGGPSVEEAMMKERLKRLDEDDYFQM